MGNISFSGLSPLHDANHLADAFSYAEHQSATAKYMNKLKCYASARAKNEQENAFREVASHNTHIPANIIDLGPEDYRVVEDAPAIEGPKED